MSLYKYKFIFQMSFKGNSVGYLFLLLAQSTGSMHGLQLLFQSVWDLP